MIAVRVRESKKLASNIVLTCLGISGRVVMSIPKALYDLLSVLNESPNLTNLADTSETVALRLDHEVNDCKSAFVEVSK